MAASFRNPSFVFFALVTSTVVFFVICLPKCSSSADEGGVLISLELIHRDSPRSPLYSPSQNPWERIANALRRSNNRINTLRHQNSINAPQSDLIFSKGEYLMNISIGSPPISFVGIADTGSDLIWTQCKPCTSCFSQKDPLFDPTNSSTFQVLPCKSKECKYIPSTTCYPKNSCSYFYFYGDMSYTKGNLSLETLTLPSSTGSTPVSFPRTIFGCGRQGGGLFSGIESGIIGLGSGKLSLVSQMGSSINGKFSYCLSSQSKLSSKINFGGVGMISSPGVVSTPLLLKSSSPVYYLVLEGISVGNKRFNATTSNSTPLSSNFWRSFKGNIVIDSGAVLSYLPTKLYSQLETAIRGTVRNLQVANDPSEALKLCYNSRSGSIDMPGVTFHFKGADVKLKTWNTFVKVKEDVLCLAFVPSGDFSLFGNVAQRNFLVEYDLKRKVVSFKPTDCSINN